MVTEQEFYFPSSDGVHSCYAHVWRPEGTPRAVVQIVHGVAEYIDRYAPFASWLAGQGFLVAGEDHAYAVYTETRTSGRDYYYADVVVIEATSAAVGTR